MTDEQPTPILDFTGTREPEGTQRFGSLEDRVAGLEKRADDLDRDLRNAYRYLAKLWDERRQAKDHAPSTTAIPTQQEET